MSDTIVQTPPGISIEQEPAKAPKKRRVGKIIGFSILGVVVLLAAAVLAIAAFAIKEVSDENNRLAAFQKEAYGAESGFAENDVAEIDTFIDTTDELRVISDTLIDTLNSEGTTPESYALVAEVQNPKLDDANNRLIAATKAISDPGVQKTMRVVANGVSDMVAAQKKIQASVASRDQAALSSAIDEYNAARSKTLRAQCAIFQVFPKYRDVLSPGELSSFNDFKSNCSF